ncbi:MAG: DUF1345 domain-containing protein [Acidimicrobiia bacterium]
MSSPTLIERVHSGRARVVVAAAIATVVAAVVGWFAPWQLTVLVWWDVAALVTLGSVWGSVARFSPEETAEFATEEDDTRAGTQLMLLGAAVVSLVGVVAAFIKANQGDRSLELLLEATGVFTIACSWALVHTVFALRYAHLYYSPPRGGIDFKMEPEPDYRDFAYTAFTVGMTFQVSDTDITQSLMRRAVLRHALLSFLFGAVILATTVNVIAGVLNA